MWMDSPLKIKFNLSTQMAKIRVENRMGVNFNTGHMGPPPLKIKILKNGFLHARGDQK